MGDLHCADLVRIVYILLYTPFSFHLPVTINVYGNRVNYFFSIHSPQDQPSVYIHVCIKEAMEDENCLMPSDRTECNKKKKKSIIERCDAEIFTNWDGESLSPNQVLLKSGRDMLYRGVLLWSADV